MSRLRILLATHQLYPFEIGGVGLYSRQLALALQRAGHQVTLLTGSEEPGDGSPRIEVLENELVGIRLLRLLRARRPRVPFFSSFLSPRVDALLKKTVRAEAPDVLHIQHLLHLSAGLAALGRRSGAGVVTTVHDFWPVCQRVDLRHPRGEICAGPRGGVRCASCFSSTPAWPAYQGQRVSPLQALTQKLDHWSRTSLRLAPCVLRTQLLQGAYAQAHVLTCPAPFLHQALQRWGFPAERLALVDYGIPPLDAAVIHAPRPHAPFRFGYLGTLGPHKGWPVALRAMGELSPGSATLSIFGGPWREPAQDAEPTSGVELRGPYGPQDLPAILTELDVVLIPSRWPETGPMVWMEATAAGLPVIASAIGALPERIRSGQDGILVPPDDHQALAAAMKQMILGYDHFRQHALQRTIRSLDHVVEELMPLYERAAHEARASRSTTRRHRS